MVAGPVLVLAVAANLSSSIATQTVATTSVTMAPHTKKGVSIHWTGLLDRLLNWITELTEMPLNALFSGGQKLNHRLYIRG